MPSNRPYRAFQETKVEIDKSIKQIIDTLKKFGVKKYGSAFDEEHIAFHFEFEGLGYRFEMTFAPSIPAQEQRRLWRVFYTSIRYDLVAVTEGLRKMHETFTWHIVDPETNRTWGESAGPETVNRMRLMQGARPLLPKGDD